MLKLKLSFLKDVRHHDARNQSQADRHKEGVVKRLGGFFTLLEGIKYREWRCSHFVLEVRFVSNCGEKSLVHVLWEQGFDILRSNVDKVRDVVGVVRIVSLVDLVRTLSVGV